MVRRLATAGLAGFGILGVLFGLDAITSRPAQPMPAADTVSLPGVTIAAERFTDGPAASLVVPEGYTRALVDCDASVSFLNRTAQAFAVNGAAAVDGDRIGLAQYTVRSGEFETVTLSAKRLLDDLQPGDDLTCAAVVWASVTVVDAVATATVAVTFYP